MDDRVDRVDRTGTAADSGSSTAIRDVKADLDERRIARGVAVGLPIVTVTIAVGAGIMLGPPIAILVLASGMLLGVIALFWASLRVLSGDAALSPELEALDATAHAVDALSSRKRMLVRALKDLDNERALGKLEAIDHEQLSTTYRAELKEVLMRIDASLEPHRPKAEDAARNYLVQAGLTETPYRGPPPRKGAVAAAAPVVDEDESEDEDEDEDEDESEDAAVPASKAVTVVTPIRVDCSACKTSNEIDASFCKKCGASLAADAAAANATRTKKAIADEP